MKTSTRILAAAGIAAAAAITAVLLIIKFA
jgi:hypothetical protein